MSTVPVQALMTLEQLLAAIEQLAPEDQLELARRLKQRRGKSLNGMAQKANSQAAADEAQLIKQTKADLPQSDRRRLKKLAAKSERETLTAAELAEYRGLAQRASQIDVLRAEALAELIKRRGQPVQAVMKEIGWRSGNDQA